METTKLNLIGAMVTMILIIFGWRIYQLVGPYAVIVVMAWAGVALSLPFWRDVLDRRQSFGHVLIVASLIAAYLI